MRGFWWDDLEHIILGNWSFPASFELIDKRYGRVWQTATTSERFALYNEIHPLMKEVNAACREDWLAQLRTWANAPENISEHNRVISLDELRSLDRSVWVSIGAHTVTHSCLSSLSPAEQKEEIVNSKRQLEYWLGHGIDIFSYPFGGRRDYDRTSINICRKAGFVKVAANFSGQAHRWSHPYEIPRHLVRNWPIETFIKELDRFWIS
jgi:hypothetical protein